TRRNPDDGAAWMVLGLLEAQRGRDGAARVAFQKAERLRPADPLASYYLGQALVLVGQSDEAAAAFDRAIGRKPTQAQDVEDVYHALALVHQRAGRADRALE